MAKTQRRKRKTELPPAPPLQAVPTQAKGSLLIIGGNENKEGHRPILEELARRVNGGKLVIATLASEKPDEQWTEYRKVFHELGVRRIQQLDVRRREELIESPKLEIVDDAKVVFFAGGDQLKITTRFGGTELCDRVRDLYRRGATIAGTSSGAAVMSETMMVAGAGDESHSSDGLRMAPGLGFIPGVIIDQHFAERGRMGRLLGAVAQNPRLLGLGIDEDTAVLFDGYRELSVLGSGAVYVVDGRGMTYTSATEGSEGAVSVYGMLLHVLSRDDRFDLESREPQTRPKAKSRHANAKSDA